MTAASLEHILAGLINDKAQLLRMAESARQLAQPDAASEVANACLELMNNA
jgi:UDP-N-acetylglucosamine:LPS N-acetylglucosamine transferase